MINNIIRDIEEGNLRFDLGFANTSRALMYRIANNKLVQKAQREMKTNPDAALLYCERAKEIYGRPVDKGYMHPDDLVLSTYMYLLGRSAHLGIRRFVKTVANARRAEFRSATAVAQYMLKHSPATTSMIARPRAPFHIPSKFKTLEGPRTVYKPLAWDNESLQTYLSAELKSKHQVFAGVA